MGNDARGKDNGSRSSVAGSWCAKHPELKGQRYRNAKGLAGTCVGCAKASATARSARMTEGAAAIRELAALKEARPYAVAVMDLERERDTLAGELEKLHAAVKELKRVGMRIYRGRDRDDDRTGNPHHGHTKLGHWDKDGSVCKSCADWNRLKELCK